MAYRNGSVETIKKIIGYLNDAKLDPNTGVYIPFMVFVLNSFSTESRSLRTSANEDQLFWQRS
jgi:hypothetical protein